MKKQTLLCLILLIALCFCSCSSAPESTSQPDSSVAEVSSQESQPVTDTPETMTFGGYYSYRNGVTDKSLEDIEWYIRQQRFI